MGRLTTHVLDTARGKPAAGLAIELFRLNGGARSLIGRFSTNADGRVEGPLLEGDSFTPGVYELVFFAGDYLEQTSAAAGGPRFLDLIPIRFGIGEDGHYHVPLLLSPFGYSTYRGS
ncbi:MAG: hydroxyisourate hydrolase [Paracoccaceae bacterium]